MKKYLILLLFIIVSLNVYSQEKIDVSLDEFITEEELNSNDVVDAWALWDQLEQNSIELQNQVRDLMMANTGMEDQLSSLSIEIANLKLNLENYKQALISNKEDTSSLLILLGESKQDLQIIKEKIALVEAREKRNTILMNIMIPTLSSIPIIIGGIEMANDNTDRGWNYIKVGAFTLLGAELVYQGGKWVFHLW